MARIEVIMPQMGESIAEGTVVSWLKGVGDAVERDENILEIATDKVDAEIPSPVTGTLAEIVVPPGATVEVGTVIGYIETDASAPTPSPTTPSAPSPAAPPAPTPAPTPVPTPAAAPPVTAAAPATSGGFHDVKPSPELSADALRRMRSTPLVRKIAAEHDVDLRAIQGSGLSGRVTKRDILDHIAAKDAAPTRAPLAVTPLPTTAPSAPAPEVLIGGRDRVEDMSRMRASIAEHMVMSRRTSPHAHTVHEVDFSGVIAAREAWKARYAERGVKLTYTAFIAKACIEALQRYPIMNSSVSGKQIIYRGEINLGVAVALEQGLIVPVIRDADEKNLLGVARAINDVAERARARRLKPEEVTGGTFTLTNPGAYGSLFGVPIINQPQVGILGCGGVKKRVVVDDQDRISVRPMAIFCLSFDHRVVDGAVADHFMVAIKEALAQPSE